MIHIHHATARRACDDVTSGHALPTQPMPLGDLLARAVNDLIPVVQLAVARARSELQATHHLVLCDTVPVEEEELDTDTCQAVVATGHVEQERLVEDRVEGSLLDACLLLGDPLPVVQNVYLHVRICNRNMITFTNGRLSVR